MATRKKTNSPAISTWQGNGQNVNMAQQKRWLVELGRQHAARVTGVAPSEMRRGKHPVSPNTPANRRRAAALRKKGQLD